MGTNLGLFGGRLGQEGLCRPVKELHLVHTDGHFVMDMLTCEREALGATVHPKDQPVGWGPSQAWLVVPPVQARARGSTVRQFGLIPA